MEHQIFRGNVSGTAEEDMKAYSNGWASGSSIFFQSIFVLNQFYICGFSQGKGSIA